MPKKTMATTTASAINQIDVSDMTPNKTLNMSGPLRFGNKFDLHRVGPGDVDHDDLGAHRQLGLRGHRFVFHRAVLHVHMYLAHARLMRGSSQINGALPADGAVDAHRAVRLQAVERLH